MAESTTTTEPTFVKCPCTHCGIRIEFDADSVGCDIECPHCGKPTLLHMPEGPRAYPIKESIGKWLGGLVLNRWISSAVIAALITYVVWLAAQTLGATSVQDALKFVAGVAGTAWGLMLFLLIVVFLIVLALLWFIFPFFVYFQLRRIKQESILARKNSDLIEDHTRQLAALALARKA